MVSSTGENLVFILSPPRSGSTLLAAMLGSHSAIACPSEPWFLLRLAAVYASATSLGWHDDGLAALATRAFIDADTFRRGAREFAATVYNTHLAQTGRRVFVDKTPRYYHIAGFVAETFPQAKLIWLQRNPFAIAASFKKTWNIEIDILTGQCVTPHTFDLSLALRSLAHHFDRPSPSHLEVRYEQLATSPETELRRICNFLELPFESGMLRYGENRALIDAYRRSDFGDRSLLDHTAPHGDAIDRWRAVLSPDEIADIYRTLGPALIRRLGYEPAPISIMRTKPERMPNPAVIAVLFRDRSPAEPSESVRDAAADLVLQTLGNADLVCELAQARAERDRWHAAYMELEKNEAYHVMEADRDRWQAAHRDMEEAYHAVAADRDRWQAAHRDMEEAYHAVAADRDRWQTAHHDMETDRDHHREQYRRLAERGEANRKQSQQVIEERTQERDHWHSAYREAQELLQRLPLRIALAIMRGIARLPLPGGRPT